MAFKSPIWRPIAGVLSAVNLVAVGVAAGSAEPWHAAIHAAIALGLGLWAGRPRPGPSAEGELQAGLEALEIEVSQMRRELGETQERLDFAERLLAQGSEARRVGPQA